VLPLRSFVETGSFHGDTIAAVAGEFDTVVSIECDPVLHAAAASRFAGVPNVSVYLGHSPDILRELPPRFLGQSVVYWLDAHWCGGGGTGNTHSECPLLAELAAIGHLKESSVVLIDDARYFLAPPPPPHKSEQWPMFDEVAVKLRALSPNHRLWVINDVIVFAPRIAAASVIEYARSSSIDLAQLARDARAPTAKVVRGPIHTNADFNQEFASEDRSERIFCYHLKRLGINAVLDIGANSGQFGAKVRRFGFDGMIYSVEPQRDAYRALLKNSRLDLRWVPLARQGAGATRAFSTLNIAKNSVSSSIRPVHANHLRAEPMTRIVEHERVFVNRSGEMLRPEVMGSIEALKIDVQGFEDQVLEGYRPLLSSVRLLLLELSMVECYEGAPDLFALDRQLVGEFGYSRISLEPSYYDSTAGVVQQYDGLYYRPESPRTSKDRLFGVEIGAVVTSVAAAIQSDRADGRDIRGDWLRFCTESWLQFGTRVVSLSQAPPPSGVESILSTGRPSIAAMLKVCPIEDTQHLLLTNADIAYLPDFRLLLPRLERNTVYYAHRTEVEARPDAPSTLVSKGTYEGGFDCFLVPAALLKLVNEEMIFPEEFLIGEPWWDYVIPVLALSRGFVLKKLPPSAGVLHHAHSARYSMDRWVQNGRRFAALLDQLRSEPNSYAAGLLDDLKNPGLQIDEYIKTLPALICRGLP